MAVYILFFRKTYPRQLFFMFYSSDTTSVTAVAASHTSKFLLRQKKSQSNFFWRRPLRVTARLDVSTAALTSQPSPLPTRQIFFGVDRCASRPSLLPTRQKKKLRKKKSRSDFFWRRPLGCVLKETYAEGGKKRLVTCVDKETYAEGGKKRLVTCVDNSVI